MNEYVKNLNRIEFVVTMACTGKCKHCSEGEHINCTGHIDTDVAVNAVREVCENYKIESLMTFGGEPLLYPDVVCAIHKVAAQMGIGKRQLITNGYFTNKKERIEEVLKELECLNIPIGSGNVIFPSGNALKYLNEYFAENRDESSPYDEDPRDIRAIGFSPNGDVLNDNVYKKSIIDILEEYQP